MAGRGDIEAGKAYVTTYIRNSAFMKGLQAMQTKLQDLGARVMKIGSAVSAIGASIQAPIAAAVSKFVDMGRQLQTVSLRTGMGAEALAEYEHAAKQCGAGLGDVEAASKSITKSIADAQMGSSGAVVALSRLGLTAQELKSQLPAEQLQTVADRLSQIKDPAMRAAMATQLLGGTNLLPIVGQMAKLRQEARDLGLVPTKKAVDEAANLGRMLDKVWGVVNATIFEVGAAVGPIVTDLVDGVINIAATVNRWVRGNHELIQTIFSIGGKIAAVGAVITAVGAIVFGIGAAFGAVATAVTTVVGLVGALLSPIALIGIGIAAATAAWLVFSGSGQRALKFLGSMFSDLQAVIDETFGGVAAALKSGNIELAGQIAIKGLQLVFMQGVNAIANSIGGVLGGTIKDIANKAIKGDFSGAWETAVKAMSTVWDQFTAGVVGAFGDVAKSILGTWQNVTTAIASKLLKLKMFGMDAKQREAEEIQQNRIRVLASGRDNALENARKAEASGDGRFMGSTAADFRKEAAGHQATLDQLKGETVDVYKEANTIVAAEIKASAESVRKVFSDFDATKAAQKATDSLEDLMQHAADALEDDAEVTRLRKEISDLRKKAEAQAAAVKGRNIGGPLGAAGGGEIANPTALRQGFSTFSGHALALGAAAEGGIQQRMLDTQKKQLEEQKKNREAIDRQTAQINKQMEFLGRLGTMGA